MEKGLCLFGVLSEGRAPSSEFWSTPSQVRIGIDRREEMGWWKDAENCQETEASLLKSPPLILLIGLITECAPLVLKCPYYG